MRSALLLTIGLVLLAWLERSRLVLSSAVALAGAFAVLLRRPKAAAEGS